MEDESSDGDNYVPVQPEGAETSGFIDDEIDVDDEIDEDIGRRSVSIPGASVNSPESADNSPGTPPPDFGFEQKKKDGDIPSRSLCQSSQLMDVGFGAVTRSAAKKRRHRDLESGVSILGKRRAPTQAIREHSEKRRKEILVLEGPDFNGKEILLRTGDPDEVRDFVVARFATNEMNLSEKSSVRLFRDNESTVLQRKKGIEVDKKEQKFNESFVGQQKQKVYEREGSVFVPRRYQSDWTLEVTQNHSGASSQPKEGVFKGKFQGMPSARYAIIALQDENTADVLLIDDYAWFSFQAAQMTDEDVEETWEEKDPQEKEITAAEKKWKRSTEKKNKAESKLSKKVKKLEENFRIAQMQRDLSMGDSSPIKLGKSYAPVGLGRRRIWKDHGNESENEGKDENFDYKLEFADDDVDQEELTEADNVNVRVAVDNEDKHKQKKRFQMFDTDSVSSGSDSDEDSNSEEEQTAAVGNSGEKSSRSGGISLGPRRGNADAKTLQAATHVKSGPDCGGAPMSRSSPALLDLSHLLPRKGTLPTVKHARAVLAALSKQGEWVLLKDCIGYFENTTKFQQDNLKKIFKEVGKFVRRGNAQGKKDTYVMLKPSGGGAGSSSH